MLEIKAVVLVVEAMTTGQAAPLIWRFKATIVAVAIVIPIIQVFLHGSNNTKMKITREQAILATMIRLVCYLN